MRLTFFVITLLLVLVLVACEKSVYISSTPGAQTPDAQEERSTVAPAEAVEDLLDNTTEDLFMGVCYWDASDNAFSLDECSCIYDKILAWFGSERAFRSDLDSASPTKWASIPGVLDCWDF